MLSPWLDAAVQQLPQLGPLVLRIPLAVGVAQREDALLGARALLVAPRAAERRVEAAGLQRVEQRLGLERAAAALRADQKRLRPVGDRLGVGVHDQPRADLGGVPVAELDHLAELVGRVDVQQRKRDRARVERLLREPQQHRRVLADRIEHHRPLELGDHLAHDVNALGLERPEVVVPQRGLRGHHARCRPGRLGQLHRCLVISSAQRTGYRGHRGHVRKKGPETDVPGPLVSFCLNRISERLVANQRDRGRGDPTGPTTTRAGGRSECHQGIDMYHLGQAKSIEAALHRPVSVVDGSGLPTGWILARGG